MPKFLVVFSVLVEADNEGRAEDAAAELVAFAQEFNTPAVQCECVEVVADPAVTYCIDVNVKATGEIHLDKQS